MDPFLKDFTDYILQNNLNIYRISQIIGDGEPETVELIPSNPCQNSYSCAKAFTLTALGLLYDEKKLSPSEKIADILSPYCANIFPGWNDITLDMVIRHHCGLPGGYLDVDCNDIQSYGEDFLACVLGYPIGEPGQYIYTDAAYYLLARVAAHKAGMCVTDYLWKKLFYPLGFQEVAWSCCPKGYVLGATGLYLRTEDMVKLPALYLNRGLYHGKRILSEEWIDLVAERNYLQRIGNTSAFGHAGMRGQMLLALPDGNRAVAWHGFGRENPKHWVAEYFG